ncbi:MAG: cytochrome c peroxidase [Gammaproteobacteria bacterium]|jgi:cytochrome c peroxidase
MKRIIFLILVLLTTAASSDKKEPPDVPNADTDLTVVDIEYPKYFPNLVVPAGYKMTEEGIALGQKLYYDKMLSQGGPLDGKSCATCHIQESGFAKAGPDDPPVMPHVNLGWLQAFLWDGHKEGTLEEVMEFEVKDFFQADLSLFRKDKEYTRAFKVVYGDDTITYQRMGEMLAMFLRTVNSFNSPVDKYLRGEEGSLSESELRGFRIYNSAAGYCFTCHRLGLFTDKLFHNNGLNAEFSGYDRGRYNVTGDEKDMGAFRTPTLRNVALRGPYMHDGRFDTLEEVVEFYNSGVNPSPALDPLMTRPRKGIRLNLTEQQKTDLVNFMKALTDTSFINNPRFSEPQE